MNFEEKKNHYKSEIDKICKEAYNGEQKQLAKYIINCSNENNIEALYTFITQRIKLGFTFDSAPEVNHNCISLVKYNDALSIKNLSQVNHKLIIGENYDALKNLLATYKSQIDMIYIDPPYNTERTKQDGNDYKENVDASKFCYRDKFTRTGYLNMMQERLIMARKLLTETGVIFISIDDTEQAYLKVLCDEIFGEDNFVLNIIRNIPDGNNINQISITHEYCLCYRKNILPKLNIDFDSNDEIDTRLTKNGNSKLKILFKKGLKAVFNEEKTFKGIIGGNSEPIKIVGEMKFKNGELQNDVELEAEWGIPSILNRLFDGEKVFDNKGQEYLMPYFTNSGVPHLKKIRNTGIFRSVQTYANDSNELIKVFSQKVFDNPKPKIMIKDLIKTFGNQSSIILDFFAGSGTTGQAVMELNEEDGGNRQCILVTNNENNIGYGICYERLYRIL